MQIQITCLKKIRNNSGDIKSYVLQEHDGEQLVVSRSKLLEIMHNPNYNIINLKLSADGRIIDNISTVKTTLTPADYIAALFRSNYETKGKTKEQIKIDMQNILHTELASRQISISTLGSWSNSLERVANIRGTGMYSVYPVTGYLLKNIGNVSIPYKRIDTESGQEDLSAISPNEIKALTRLETTTLLMDAKFSFKIHNAKIYPKGLGLGRHEDMLNCYLYSTIPKLNNINQIPYTELPESEQARFWK